MLLGAVSLVAKEAVFREEPMHPIHQPVPDHLGHDGRAGDAQAFGISIHNGNRSNRTAGRNPRAVDQNRTGRMGKPPKSPNHGPVAGGMDPDPVDLFLAGPADPDMGALKDRPKGLCPG